MIDNAWKTFIRHISLVHLCTVHTLLFRTRPNPRAASGGMGVGDLIRPLRLCSSLDEALLIPANNEVDLWFLYYLMFYKNILKYILYLERDILKYNYFW